jgi:lipopolysaccharide export system permease protein
MLFMVFDRYLLRHLGFAGGFIALALAMIVMLTQSLRFLELIINSGASGMAFLTLTLLAMPRFFEVILPISLMIGTVFIYNRLQGDSELVVLRAAGVSPLMQARPALILACLCTFCLFIISGWLAPMALSKMQMMRVAIKAEYSNFLLREGVFNSVGRDMTVFIAKRGVDGALEGVMIHDSRASNPFPVTVIAKRGVIVTEDDIEQVLVFDGSRQSFNPRTGALSRLDFERYSLDLPDSGPAGQRYREPDERTLSELFNPSAEVKAETKLLREFLVEAHRRFASPFLAISFTSIALCFVLLGSVARQGMGGRILAASLLVISLQGLYLMAYNIAIDNLGGLVLMHALVWIPMIISLLCLSPAREKILSQWRSYRLAIQRGGVIHG